MYSSFEESSDGNPIKLIFDALHKEFCDALPDNDLIDYQIRGCSTSVQNTKHFIRFLLVDNCDEILETLQLKYILTIEFDEVFKKSEGTHRLINFIPIITLRSVYDDESSERSLNINVDNITIETNTDCMKYNKIATKIKTLVLNTMHKSHYKTVVPVLTHYDEWNPSNSLFESFNRTATL